MDVISQQYQNPIPHQSGLAKVRNGNSRSADAPLAHGKLPMEEFYSVPFKMNQQARMPWVLEKSPGRIYQELFWWEPNAYVANRL